MNKETWCERWGYPLLIVIVLFVVMGIVGEMDYQDAILEHEAYCKNVAEGVWPDYKKIFEENCTFDGKRVDDE